MFSVQPHSFGYTLAIDPKARTVVAVAKTLALTEEYDEEGNHFVKVWALSRSRTGPNACKQYNVPPEMFIPEKPLIADVHALIAGFGWKPTNLISTEENPGWCDLMLPPSSRTHSTGFPLPVLWGWTGSHAPQLLLRGIQEAGSCRLYVASGRSLPRLRPQNHCQQPSMWQLQRLHKSAGVLRRRTRCFPLFV